MIRPRPEEAGKSVLASMEILSGLLAGVLGILGFAYTLIDVEVRFDPATTIGLVILVISVVGTVVGTLLHHQLHLKAGLALLWVSALVLMVTAVVTSFTFGGYLLPAAGVALLAATTGSGTSPSASRTTSSP